MLTPASIGAAGDDGAPTAEGLVRFGAVGSAEVSADDDVLIVLAPQSMVGASIYEPLRAMVDAAEAQGTSIILINPLLQDRQSSSGVMGVRGRAERMAFADSFEDIYTFRNVYSGTTFMFPILGCLRMTREAGGRCVLFQRKESDGSERYEPVGCWLGREPTAPEITELIPNQVASVDRQGAASAVLDTGKAGPVVERMPWD